MAGWEAEVATARQQAEEVRELLEQMDAAIPLQARLQEVLQLRRDRDRLLLEIAPLASRLDELGAALQLLEEQSAAAREECDELDSAGSPDLLRRQAEDIRKAVRRRADIAKYQKILDGLKADAEPLAEAMKRAEAELKQRSPTSLRL